MGWVGARRRCLQRAVSQPAMPCRQPAKLIPLSTSRYHLHRVHRGQHDYPDNLSRAKQSVPR
jgi:hypothetical protein